MKQEHNYKGVKFSMMVPPGNLDAMATFEVRPDDIFLVTYPKCGIHWLFEITNLILTGGDPDKIDRTCMESSLEMAYLKDKTDMTSFEPFYKKLEAKIDRRVIVSHLPESFLPPQVFTKKPKVIYVARNPKDCGVSIYTALKEMGAASEWEEFVEEWTKQEELTYGGYFKHVLDFWKHRNDLNVLFMKYEDMKKDPRGSIVRFADHLECNLTDEKLKLVVHHSEVNNMKKTYDDIEKNVPGGVFLTRIFGKAPFIRKGEIGDWKNHFTVAQNEQFDAKIRENLRGTGLVFDFEYIYQVTNCFVILTEFKMSAAEQFSTEKFQKGYYHYKGIKFHMMMIPPGNLDAMATFEVRPDDIFLVTYAKCGTHWSNEIINLILTGGDPDKIDRTCQEAALEMSYIKDKTDIKSFEPFYKKMEAKKARRVILTHLPESLLPPQVFTKKPKISMKRRPISRDSDKKCCQRPVSSKSVIKDSKSKLLSQVIYVTRNPKDCGVSLYHAKKGIGMSALDESWSTFVDEWIKQEDCEDKLLMGGFFTHVLEYWKHRHDSNFLYMKYEDMKRDPRGSIVKFADHLQRTLTDEELDKVVHHSEVKNMKKTYDNVEKNVKDGVFLTKAMGKSSFIRKGQIGDWKNHFTVAQNEKFDAVIRENLHETGLVFDFE
ncbi:uncharacterized protein [Antedon mediterranea]|uniref:uncharacterized protein n=1 Tax=Antedon mediterranea TaxID=105859 RepID=UPI003AF73B17